MYARINFFLVLWVIGIVVASFYAVILILYFLPSSPTPPIFTLNVNNPNWRVATSSTTAIPVKEGIQIESVSKEGEYELLTDAIVGHPGRVYTLSYHLMQQAGRTVIGVYDNVTGKWITSKAVGQAKDEIQFLPPRNAFQIALQNGSASHNKAILVELTVGERR